jgi:hypothetical protein
VDIESPLHGGYVTEKWAETAETAVARRMNADCMVGYALRN